MNTLLINLHTTAITRMDLDDVDQPSYDPNTPGLNFMQTVGGWAITGTLWASVIAVILCGALMLFGHLGKHSQLFSRALIGLCCAVCGVVVAGSAAIIVNIAGNQSL